MATHARILLFSDENREGGASIDTDIATTLNIGKETVKRVRRRCVEEGVEAVLNRKRRLNRRAKVLDEKPGVQAVANAVADRSPVAYRQPGVARDAEYRRLGTLSFLAALELHTGDIVATRPSRAYAEAWVVVEPDRNGVLAHGPHLFAPYSRHKRGLTESAGRARHRGNERSPCAHHLVALRPRRVQPD